jgi:hypothetical protein
MHSVPPVFMVYDEMYRVKVRSLFLATGVKVLQSIGTPTIVPFSIDVDVCEAVLETLLL